MELLFRSTPYEVRQIGDPKERTLCFTASDETLDRYETVIRVDGWKLDGFIRNSVFLWSHNPGAPPVGRVVKLERGTAQRDVRGTKRNVKTLDAHVQFADRDTYEFADVIYRLYQKGFLRGVSVGFKPLKQRDITDETELRELGADPATTKRVVDLYENELWELSAVSIPGNVNALAKELCSPEYVERGIKLVEADVVKAAGGLVEESGEPRDLATLLETLRTQLRAPAMGDPASGASSNLPAEEGDEDEGGDSKAQIKEKLSSIIVMCDELADLCGVMGDAEGEEPPAKPPGKPKAPPPEKSVDLTEVLSRLDAQKAQLDALGFELSMLRARSDGPRPKSTKSAVELALEAHEGELKAVLARLPKSGSK